MVEGAIKKVFLIIAILLASLLLWKFVFGMETRVYVEEKLNQTYNKVIEDATMKNGDEREKSITKTFNSGINLSR